jgi:30S ribosomal protein S31
MGKGDKRTTKGKRFKGSYGKTRPQGAKKATAPIAVAPTPAARGKTVRG